MYKNGRKWKNTFIRNIAGEEGGLFHDNAAPPVESAAIYRGMLFHVENSEHLESGQQAFLLPRASSRSTFRSDYACIAASHEYYPCPRQ